MSLKYEGSDESCQLTNGSKLKQDCRLLEIGESPLRRAARFVFQTGRLSSSMPTWSPPILAWRTERNSIEYENSIWQGPDVCWIRKKPRQSNVLRSTSLCCKRAPTPG